MFIMWFGVPTLLLLMQKIVVSPRWLYGAMVVAAAGDALATLHIARPTLYTDANRSWWMTVDARHVKDLDLTPKGLVRQLDPPVEVGTFQNNRNAVLKIATLQGYITMSNRYEAQMAIDPTLNFMALGANRIWFSQNAVQTPPVAASFELLGQKTRESGRPVIFLHSPEQMRELSHPGQASTQALVSQNLREATPALPVTVSELSYRPNWLSFKYVAPTAGWLLVTDRWAPGWELTVNGQQKKLYGADFAFRAVPVGAGPNKVLFRYRPQPFFWCLGISWGTLFAVISLELWKRYGRPRVEAAKSHAGVTA
jgi:hypothetical protein